MVPKDPLKIDAYLLYLRRSPIPDLKIRIRRPLPFGRPQQVYGQKRIDIIHGILPSKYTARPPTQGSRWAFI